MKPLRTIAAAVAALFAVSAAPAWAGGFTVNTEKDLLDANLADDVCAAANGKCALRAAVAQSNATAGLNTIDLPPGTYKLTRPRQAAGGNDEGDLDVTEAALISGADGQAANTVIKQTVKDRVVYNDGVPAGFLPGTAFADLTITGGRITKASDQSGGGILSDASMYLQEAIVRGNSVHPSTPVNTFGGGIAQREGELLVQFDSAVKDNRVQLESETGGAVGGGIFVESAGALEVSESIVKNNVAKQTGGAAGDSTGGGIYSRGELATITRSTIAANVAEVGGGLTITQGGDLAMEATTVSGNEAKEGGGLEASTIEELTITNSTFSGNRAAAKGPEVHGTAIDVTLADLVLQHDTFAENEPFPGQATLELDAAIGTPTVAITGSILDDHRKECNVPAAAFATNELNVYEDASCVEGISTNLVAGAQLMPLDDNGGLTRTHMLKPASPALDFVGSGCPPPASDQRDMPRPAGNDCDAGAVEAG